jgi:GH35 family endo-1,4-beta-xylanase
MNLWPLCALALLALADESSSWKKEAEARIETHRKGTFTLTLPSPLPPGPVAYRLVRHDFLFGTCAPASLIGRDTPESRQFEAWTARTFNALVAENAMKWYENEKEPGVLRYEDADRIADFARRHHLALRGHCLLWDKEKYVQDWVRALDRDALATATWNRIRSVAGRYHEKVICWDVNNEMLNGGFFRKRLGPTAQAEIFRRAAEASPGTPLYPNEYGILAQPEKTGRYLDLIRTLRREGAPLGGIGIQEHAAERFVPPRTSPSEESPDGPPERERGPALHPHRVWESLDTLATENLPIHITEISFKTRDELRKADALDTAFRVWFAHPAVEAIMLWGYWEGAHWLGSSAALVNRDWTLRPAGERLQKLIHEEWTTKGQADPGSSGSLSFRGFYGTYEFTLADGRTHRATFTRHQTTARWPPTL